MNKSFLKSFLSICALMVVCSVSAQQVDKELALQKAQAFLNKNAANRQSVRKAPRKVPKLVLANDSRDLYVFNDEANGGYVVVSGDKRMPDVLGYSYEGHFDLDNIPCNMQAWLDGYAKQVSQLKSDYKEDVKLSHRANSSWTPIPPMIKCKWGQGTPHNNQCPEIDGEHASVGCVATAMAQIMFYHQWPKHTMNIISGYTTQTQGIAVPDIPITMIDWDNMIPNYVPYFGAHNYTEEQADAVATLMKLCGTAVKMDYDLKSSSAYNQDVPYALCKYFDYDGQIEELEVSYYDMDEWNQIVYEELYNGRPVLCAQPGHALVIDGYDKDDYFHMNFGEVTAVDGYFLLSEQQVYNIIIGIQPNSIDAPHAYAIVSDGKLTYFFDKKKENRDGELFPGLIPANTDIEECEFHSSFANIKLRNLESFFENCKNLKTIKGISYLNTSEVKTMRRMFNGCSSLESLDLSGFNTEKVMDMLEMFGDCSSLTSLDISSFNTEKVTNMMNMFCRCSSLTSLDVSCFNTKNVNNMCGLFYGLESLVTLDVSNFITKEVTDMSLMFQGCSSLTELDLSNFDTPNVNNMYWMFSRCNNLTSLNVSGFKTGNVQDMEGMFFNCPELTILDLSGFNTEKTTNMGAMFAGCYNISTINVSESWNMSNIENSIDMFCGCYNIIGGAGTIYDDSYIDGEYARIDEGPENPGYFTYKEAMGIPPSVVENDVCPAVYSLSGVKVRAKGEGTDGLPTGFYIVGGKKIIVSHRSK